VLLIKQCTVFSAILYWESFCTRWRLLVLSHSQFGCNSGRLPIPSALWAVTLSFELSLCPLCCHSPLSLVFHPSHSAYWHFILTFTLSLCLIALSFLLSPCHSAWLPFPFYFHTVNLLDHQSPLPFTSVILPNCLFLLTFTMSICLIILPICLSLSRSVWSFFPFAFHFWNFSRLPSPFAFHCVNLLDCPFPLSFTLPGFCYRNPFEPFLLCFLLFATFLLSLFTTTTTTLIFW
jgi:hypothetical protein